MADLRRRQFITLLGGAGVAWSLPARAQRPAMTKVGFLYPASPDTIADRVRGFRQGLKDVGYIEGENVAIEYRGADGQFDRLPALAAELVRQQVAVIAAGNLASALAAKAATTTVPIVFAVGEDPVRFGLVATLARPDSNLTGINFLNVDVTTKRLELLRELVPGASRVAVLVNPTNRPVAELALRHVAEAGRALDLQTQIINASTSREIDAAFAALSRTPPDGLFVSGDALFTGRRVQVTIAAARHAVPATYSTRAFTDVGGLMSYGGNVPDAYRQVGIYVGRILKGGKPADLPVVQASKFELVINAQTARTMGLSVPPSLLAIADEVIE
jgi:putative ABC transport system substrate-binding protein